MGRNKLTPNKCAVACWRADVEDLNVDLQDAGPPLVDYPFAGDILMIEIAYHVIGTVFDKFVENLAAEGDSSIQPPSRLQTPNIKH